ncbi:MAG TPA: peptide-methionine (S)-S-oxide reductase MsrA [Fimbriimonas sp.]|nr:peptide-methionine (S)-S-oxide reductase MsrA [Fimbriimonas sp.]
MKSIAMIGLALGVAAVAIAMLQPAPAPKIAQPEAQTQNKKMEGSSLVVAGGCFWCVEAQFESLKGVYQVESAYVGGNLPNATYEKVLTGTTGHAEAIKIFYDPKVVSEEDLLNMFFVAHDPTTLNRQGPDVGTQYRSALFYEDAEQQARFMKAIKSITAEKIYNKPIVTTIEPMRNYTRAEEYHQNYFEKYEKASDAERAKMNSGYCSFVVSPKVAKFREKYRDKLKKD